MAADLLTKTNHHNKCSIISFLLLYSSATELTVDVILIPKDTSTHWLNMKDEKSFTKLFLFFEILVIILNT